MSIYQMGQIRFAGADSCLGVVPSKIGYWDTYKNNCHFTDVCIELSNGGTFEIDKDYYFQVNIPREEYADLTINAKLVKRENDNYEDVYQWLASAKVEGLYDTDKFGVDVVLFINPFNGTQVLAAVPVVCDEIPLVVEAYTLYRVGGEYYYCTDPNGECEKVVHATTNTMIKSWEASRVTIEDGEATTSIEVAFRPIEQGFSHIVLEIERTGEDMSIEDQIVDENGNVTGVRYGRVIELSTYKLQEIKNLIPLKDKESKEHLVLSHIGVWGKPGTLMSINGEGIYIGPRGYYEQDSIPIKSIGVVAESHNKMFTIDYKYKE